MSAYVYILFSSKLDRFYTGLTTLCVGERLENHISKKYGKANFTQKANDLTLFFSLECESLSQALKIELHIKKMKSRNYFLNLARYPVMVQKILNKYRSS